MLCNDLLIRCYSPAYAAKIGRNITGYEGKVISVDLRYTKLESEDGTVLIPNSKCFTDPVVVFSKD